MTQSTTAAGAVLGFILLLLVQDVSSFNPKPTISTTNFINRAEVVLTSTSRLHASSKDVDENNIFATFFTGGAFSGEEAEAIKIASKIRSIKDLGWTGESRRRGETRPRHRAWGGNGELPVQLKAGYDPSNPFSPEKWLSLEEFCAKTKSSGAATDIVFVAFAKGAAFAERDFCEATIEKWNSNGKFDEGEFLKSVKTGQRELAIGWAVFLSLNSFCAGSIIFPTNPLMVAFVGAIEGLQANL